jgi:hypothetical protein
MLSFCASFSLFAVGHPLQISRGFFRSGKELEKKKIVGAESNEIRELPDRRKFGSPQKFHGDKIFKFA